MLLMTSNNVYVKRTLTAVWYCVIGLCETISVSLYLNMEGNAYTSI